MGEEGRDRASVAVVLSVAVLVAVILLCPIVGVLIEAVSKWETSFPH
jgi:hypothetical protein